MHASDRRHDCQAKPVIGVPMFARPVCSIEAVEQARQMLDRNLRPDVADGQADA